MKNKSSDALISSTNKKTKFPVKPHYEGQGITLKKLNQIYNGAKNRARKMNIDFNLTKDDIIIPNKCPLLGIEIKPGIKKVQDCSPSLDRIDNDKGYIKGNVRIVSYLANRMKNSASREQLKVFAKTITEYVE